MGFDIQLQMLKSIPNKDIKFSLCSSSLLLPMHTVAFCCSTRSSYLCTFFSQDSMRSIDLQDSATCLPAIVLIKLAKIPCLSSPMSHRFSSLLLGASHAGLIGYLCSAISSLYPPMTIIANTCSNG